MPEISADVRQAASKMALLALELYNGEVGKCVFPAQYYAASGTSHEPVRGLVSIRQTNALSSVLRSARPCRGPDSRAGPRAGSIHLRLNRHGRTNRSTAHDGVCQAVPGPKPLFRPKFLL